jgi:hypothetical protein
MNSYFSPEALEALQQAYEMQLTPEEQDFDATTGLPTNVVSGTSPWHNSVDLWRYPDGKNKLETSPIMYRADEDEDEYEDPTIDDIADSDEYEDDETLSDEEIDNLIEELLQSDEE